MTAATSAIATAIRGRGALIVALAMLGVFAYAAYESQTWPSRSRLFATTLTVPALLLAFAQVVRDARAIATARIPPPPEAAVARLALVWAAAFFVFLWVIGLTLTVPLFTAAYIRFAAKERAIWAVTYGIASWLFITIVFDRLLHVPLPGGLIPIPGMP